MIHIKTKPGETRGKIVIESEGNRFSGVDIGNRIEALLNLLSSVNLDEINKDDIYYCTEVIKDYLPNAVQMNRIQEHLIDDDFK